MKTRNLFLFSFILIFFTLGCKKTTTEDPAPVAATYSVDYKLVLPTSYDGLQVTYYESGLVKKTITSVISPWEMKLENFVAGDSAYFEVKFNCLPASVVSYEVSMAVTSSGSILFDEGEPVSATGLTEILPVDEKYVFEIPK